MMVGGIVLLAVPAMLLRAWALRILWGWFVVGYFSLPALTYVEAMGLAIVVGMFKSTHVNKTQEGETAHWGAALIDMFSGPLLAVGTGWLVRYFGGVG
jgi:hypothetical protein